VMAAPPAPAPMPDEVKQPLSEPSPAHPAPESPEDAEHSS
jgi:hypothetical protein